MTRDTDEWQRLVELLKTLEQFPKTRAVWQLRKELQAKLEKVETRIRRRIEEPLVKQKQIQKRRQEANIAKASKLKKYHHYIRLIRDNFPDFSYTEIRTMLKARREGKDVSIPDAVWQNPSP